MGIDKNNFKLFDFDKLLFFEKYIGNTWFSDFYDRIYDFIWMLYLIDI